MADEKKSDKKAQRPGFSESGKPYPGVDPKTGERVTVTLAALKSEFGPKTGEERYVRIAQAAGLGVTQFRLEEYAPDISLAGLSDEARAQVDAALTEKE